MSAQAPVKPQLHSSHFQLLYRCGEKFRRVVLEGQREPQTVALAVGTGSHRVVAKNLQRKLETGVLMPTEEVQELARDTFTRTWDEAPIMLMPNEAEEGLSKTKGAATDLCVKLITKHHQDLAPSLQPAPNGIEEPWVIECKGYPYDLAGSFDLRERFTLPSNGDFAERLVRRIRDLKTRKKAPSQGEADTLEQFSIYGMADAILNQGKVADSMHLDVLVKPTKTMAERLITLETKRDIEDFKVVRARFERAITVIQSGAFTPASQQDWWCSREFCGFAADGSCQFFNHRKTVVSLTTSDTQSSPTKGANYVNGRTSSRKTIDPGSAEWRDAIGK